jgi:hypothetical protein
VEFKSKQQLIVDDIRPKLIKGKRYTSDEIKDLLRETYIKFNLNIVPKIKDFEQYFEGRVNKTRTILPNGSRIWVYEVLI